MHKCQIENCPQQAQAREVRVLVAPGTFLNVKLCQFCADLAATERLLRGRVV